MILCDALKFICLSENEKRLTIKLPTALNEGLRARFHLIIGKICLDQLLLFIIGTELSYKVRNQSATGPDRHVRSPSARSSKLPSVLVSQEAFLLEM